MSYKEPSTLVKIWGSVVFGFLVITVPIFMAFLLGIWFNLIWQYFSNGWNVFN